MKIVIIIPTYNERENIGPLIKLLLAQFEILRHKFHILVVDDRSPDGTAGVVSRLQDSVKNLHLLIGKKQGLGKRLGKGASLNDILPEAYASVREAAQRTIGLPF